MVCWLDPRETFAALDWLRRVTVQARKLNRRPGLTIGDLCIGSRDGYVVELQRAMRCPLTWTPAVAISKLQVLDGRWAYRHPIWTDQRFVLPWVRQRQVGQIVVDASSRRGHPMLHMRYPKNWSMAWFPALNLAHAEFEFPYWRVPEHDTPVSAPVDADWFPLLGRRLIEQANRIGIVDRVLVLHFPHGRIYHGLYDPLGPFDPDDVKT